MQQQLSCPNCDNSDTQDSKFCSNCSQKTKLKLNNVGRMFVNFAAGIIDYDSKLFASVRGLFYPGFLTNEYLAFKRVQYLTPIRLFVFLMFSCFFIMSWQGFDNVSIDAENDFALVNVDLETQTNDSNYNLLEKTSPKMRRLSLISNLLDELEKQKLLLENNKQDNSEQELKQIVSAIVKLQTLKESSQYDESDTFTFTLFFKNYIVQKSDINTLSAAQLIEKYNVENWIEKLFVESFIKFNQDANGFGKFIFQNLIWVVILEILLMSLVFKLFYSRAKKLYVEHFIFHLHIRAFLFFLGIVFLLIPYTINKWVAIILSISIFIYILAAFFKVYQQSKILMTVKFFILSIIEIFIVTISLVLVMLISSLLFKFF